MARDRMQSGAPAARSSRGGVEPDLEADDELIPVTRESSRGGKGAPLSAEERERAKRESPLSD